MPETIEQLLEASGDPGAHCVQLFSVLLLLMTLGVREPDALNQKEVAELVGAWFSRLLSGEAPAKDKLDSNQMLMLFFSCFAFGPLALVAPMSQAMFGDAYQTAVDRVEHIVNQQDSGSFDKAMILVLSLLKSLDRRVFVERTGDFVSRKKVPCAH